jgi:carboxymethylenebutenolidase
MKRATPDHETSHDDQKEPQVKDMLCDGFAAAKVRAEIEVFKDARHGFCVPDSKPAAESGQDAARAWAKLVALYKSAL